MSSIFLNLPDLYNSYKSWISKNPQSASDFESTAKFLSYFIAGRIGDSYAVTELVYCLSNLLVLFNDRIICKELKLENQGPSYNLKVWLTVLEYSQVFIELSSKKLWGNTGKWLVIVCIQVFRCVARLILVYYYKERMIENPPIPILQRHGCENGILKTSNSDVAQMQIDSISFTLKRTGRLIRKVDASPPIAFRSWKPIQRIACENSEIMDNVLTQRQLVAETIYILKPIAHLGSLSYFGDYSWKPWILSLLFDVASLQLHRSCKSANPKYLSKQQRLQISRRTLALLLYLLRSPFYDRYSASKIIAFLNALSNHVPLASIICKPVAQYLPFWQKTYFYTWST